LKKSKLHPHPLKNRPRDPELEEIVGWFMVGFNDNPDHEYSFQVSKDGTIAPQLDLVDSEPTCRLTFFRYIAERELHHVRFVQRTGTDAGKEIEHDPWKPDQGGLDKKHMNEDILEQWLHREQR
jgi:hypothetical protein